MQQAAPPNPKMMLLCRKIKTNFTEIQCTNVSSNFWSQTGGGRSGPSHEGAGAGADEGAFSHSFLLYSSSSAKAEIFS